MKKTGFFFGSRAKQANNPLYGKGRTGGTTKDVGEDNKDDNRDEGTYEDIIDEDNEDDVKDYFEVIVGSEPNPTTNEAFMSILLEIYDLKKFLDSVPNLTSPISARMYLHLGTYGLEIVAYAKRSAASNPPNMQIPWPPMDAELAITATHGVNKFKSSLSVTAENEQARGRVINELHVERESFNSEEEQLLGIAFALQRLSLLCLTKAKVFYEGRGTILNSPLRVNIDPFDPETLATRFALPLWGKRDYLWLHALTVRELFVSYYDALMEAIKPQKGDLQYHKKMVPKKFANALRRNGNKIKNWIIMLEIFEVDNTLTEFLTNKKIYIENRLTTTINIDYLVKKIDKDEAAEWYKKHKLDDLGNCGRHIHPADKGFPKLLQIELALGRFHLKQKPILKEDVFA